MMTNAPRGIKTHLLARGQRGASIIAAIFMLLLFAALAAYMVSMTSSANIASAQDVQGARAYQAAQAGLEWGLLQVLDPNNATVSAMVSPYGSGAAGWPNMPVCPADTALVVDGFSVTVRCARFPLGAVGPAGPPVYTEAGGTRSIIVYELTSTAQTSGSAIGSVGYVEREVAASASKCRSLDSVAPDYVCP
jgi:MSHA biogenesis protein MshP